MVDIQTGLFVKYLKNDECPKPKPQLLATPPLGLLC